MLFWLIPPFVSCSAPAPALFPRPPGSSLPIPADSLASLAQSKLDDPFAGITERGALILRTAEVVFPARHLHYAGLKSHLASLQSKLRAHANWLKALNADPSPSTSTFALNSADGASAICATPLWRTAESLAEGLSWEWRGTADMQDDAGWLHMLLELKMLGSASQWDSFARSVVDLFGSLGREAINIATSQSDDTAEAMTAALGGSILPGLHDLARCVATDWFFASGKRRSNKAPQPREAQEHEQERIKVMVGDFVDHHCQDRVRRMLLHSFATSAYITLGVLPQDVRVGRLFEEGLGMDRPQFAAAVTDVLVAALQRLRRTRLVFRNNGLDSLHALAVPGATSFVPLHEIARYVARTHPDPSDLVALGSTVLQGLGMHADDIVATVQASKDATWREAMALGVEHGDLFAAMLVFLFKTRPAQLAGRVGKLWREGSFWTMPKWAQKALDAELRRLDLYDDAMVEAHGGEREFEGTMGTSGLPLLAPSFVMLTNRFSTGLSTTRYRYRGGSWVGQLPVAVAGLNRVIVRASGLLQWLSKLNEIKPGDIVFSVGHGTALAADFVAAVQALRQTGTLTGEQFFALYAGDAAVMMAVDGRG